MNWQALAYLALVGNQLLATAVFLALYLRGSDWHRNAVGRHWLYWMSAAFALDLSWVLLLVLAWPWLVFALLAAQAALGGLAWQRVWLVWRATRSGSRG